MRYKGPKNRIARRENMDLGLKTPGSKSHANLLKKLNVFPGQHGTRGRRKISEHARQLREKQKLRFAFNLSESQMKNYFKHSIRKTGNTALFLSQYLEKRLDNVIYRMGFTPTRTAARQLVAHGHIKVNDKNMKVPSYQVRVGDVITFANPKTQKIPAISTSLERKDTIIPHWIEKKGVAGKLTAEPTADILDKQVNLRLVVEFYSR